MNFWTLKKKNNSSPMEWKEKLKMYKWLLFVLAIFLISAGLISLAFYNFNKTYEERIYPNVYVGKIKLGGMTKEEARQELNRRIDIIKQNGIIFDYQGNKAVVSPILQGNDFIINFDVEKTSEKAYRVGRGLNYLINLRDKLRTEKKPIQIEAETTIDNENIKKLLSENFSIFEKPAKDAELAYEYDRVNKKFRFSIKDEELGIVADYEKGLKEMEKKLKQLDNSKISLISKEDKPLIYKNDCLNIETKANDFLQNAPFKLSYEGQIKEIDEKTLVKLIGFKLADDNDNKITVKLKDELVIKFLEENFAKEIDKEPVDAKFQIKDGRVEEFQASQNGKKLNIDLSLEKMHAEIGKDKEIELVVDTIESNIKNGTVNTMGIKEKLGTGKSNFAGSPKNRRHNIATGAKALNGILIEPGEEFSTIKSLGAIDASTGYLPELVIKENKTIPEYGGGLCQIGTTVFRAALASGLPITMRRNHSYRVQYYEPAGTDATIYDPVPDLRFKNDTNNYILVQSRIEGNLLYFDFWGTSDGRKASTTYPKIYNIVKPQPTKIIETTNLKPGEKKCTESAHNGADAYFDYTVTYQNGEKKEERFSSHYVPWREVCLLGVEKLESTTQSTDLSTSTAENKN